MQYGSYLVCKQHLEEVKNFLGNFLTPKEDGYSHEKWVTFEVPGVGFLINLMKGADQDITQNFTIEIYFDSLERLSDFATKYGLSIDSFEAKKSEIKYVYHYVEIPGPENICKIEASYTQNL